MLPAACTSTLKPWQVALQAVQQDGCCLQYAKQLADDLREKVKALGYDRHKLVVQVGSKGLGLSYGLSMHDWASQSGRTRCVEADAERLALLQQASSFFTTVLGLLPIFARVAHSLAL